MLSSLELLTIQVAARSSNLSRAQVKEVFHELKTHHPHIAFSCTFVETTGDKDLTTSLRTLDKTDFFTKEADELILTGTCHIAIHSAKDLPEPLPQGLEIIALTKGQTEKDALVLREDTSQNTLPQNPIIATSSVRREGAVKKILPNAAFIDIRGTIEKRLEKLFQGHCDGVVIAESALIRLRLDHLNRILLDSETTPLQGRLAVVAKTSDNEMKTLFSSIDQRE